MKQNNKKFNNAMHKFVGVLDKYALSKPNNKQTHIGYLSLSDLLWI